jgi:N-methylhydantoinase B
MNEAEKKIEPFLMSILAGRFRAITKEMSNTLMRSSRSTVMNTAKDFSCAITDDQCRIVFIAEGLPIQLAAINLIPKAVKDLFGDDIHPGDVFLNNSPFYGNLHHADATVTAPVFYKGKLRFFVTNRAHQADTGAPEPTVFLPFAVSVQQEGLHVPCVRVQRNYEDIKDVVRMVKYRMRVPEQWYGDYIAQVGSLRVAERKLVEMCDKYGADTLGLFVNEWQEYGMNRMIAEIGHLPPGQWEGEVTHDPIPGIAPDGITIKGRISIDPGAGYIDVDIRDNPDCIPCGFNLSEAATIGAVLAGILYNLDPTIPHNDGAFNRVRIAMREGCIVGKPVYPIGTSVCTTNVCDRLISLMQSIMAKIGPGYGMAEGRSTLTAASSVVSGTDWRRNGAPFINFLAFPPCGPAVAGHDGWITYAVSAAGGAVFTDSIELDEQKYPLVFDKNELVTDSAGAGEWDGAPATDVIYGPRKDPATVAWVIDEKHFPARGVRGGIAGRRCDVFKMNVKTGGREVLPTMATMAFTADERVVSEAPGGAGYGDPLDRDPKLVALRVREEWISPERARSVYGVVVVMSGEHFAVDYDATARLREHLKKERV